MISSPFTGIAGWRLQRRTAKESEKAFIRVQGQRRRWKCVTKNYGKNCWCDHGGVKRWHVVFPRELQPGFLYQMMLLLSALKFVEWLGLFLDEGPVPCCIVVEAGSSFARLWRQGDSTTSTALTRSPCVQLVTDDLFPPLPCWSSHVVSTDPAGWRAGGPLLLLNSRHKDHANHDVCPLVSSTVDHANNKGLWDMRRCACFPNCPSCLCVHTVWLQMSATFKSLLEILYEYYSAEMVELLFLLLSTSFLAKKIENWSTRTDFLTWSVCKVQIAGAATT